MAPDPTIGRSVSIGRSQDNDLVLKDLLVSRHHARVTQSIDGMSVEDPGSTTGTFVSSASNGT